MKKVVVIGGGTGQSIILKALKELEDIDLKTIVTVADDGGSTGRLRDIFDIPAVGDIRNVMVALSDNESLLANLMTYRFGQEAMEFSGHNLGNLMFAAMIKQSDSFLDAVYKLSKVLKIKGEVIPSTELHVTLCALMEDQQIVCGEHHITNYGQRVKQVFYDSPVEANQLAVQAIMEAEYIVFSIGSLYTSILSNIVIEQIRSALCVTKAQKIYFCNVMSELGETMNYSVEDHVEALCKHMGSTIDTVVASNTVIPAAVLSRYHQEKASEVKLADTAHPYEVIEADLCSFHHDLIRHDVDKCRIVLERLIK
jgi:uncharacterized cofD-like protein